MLVIYVIYIVLYLYGALSISVAFATFHIVNLSRLNHRQGFEGIDGGANIVDSYY